MSRPSHYGKWGQRGKLKQERVAPKHCRWCGDPIPPKTRRTSYCSAECYRECWLRISWPTMRFHIINRDKTCRLCDGESYKVRRHSWDVRQIYSPEFRTYLRYTELEAEWHVDHILPVSEGGTDDPDNLRLLCGRCHKRVTREWHGERAAARRRAQPQTMVLI